MSHAEDPLVDSHTSDPAPSFTEQTPTNGSCSLDSLKVKLSQRAGSLIDSYKPVGREMWAGEMAQREEALAAKPDGPSSIPWTHIVEGENYESR